MKLKTMILALSLSWLPLKAAAQVVSWCTPTTYTDGSPIETTGSNALTGFRFFCGATPGTYSVVQDLAMGSPDLVVDADCKQKYGSIAMGYKSAFNVPFGTNYCTMTAYTAGGNESDYAPAIAFNWPLDSTTSPFAPQNMRISRRGWFDLALAEPRSSVVGLARRSETVKVSGERFAADTLSIVKKLAELKAAGAGLGRRLDAPQVQIQLASAEAPPKG